MKNLFKISPLSTRYDVAILLLRIVVGLAMMFHGFKKIQNPLGWMGDDSATPAIFQALAAISEFVGGFSILIGLLTPLAAFGILCTMVVAIYKHAITQGGPFVGKGSFELPLVYFCIMIVLIATGAGKLSADRLVFGTKEK
jgi:putative oxidoreductase